MSNELENTAAEAMPEKWVNLEDIADHLSVSTDTVRNWIKDVSCRSIKLENDINSRFLK